MASKYLNNSFNLRSSLLTAFLLCFFAVIIVRLFYLDGIKGAAARQAADQQHNIYQKLFPSRGEIDLADPNSSVPIPLATNSKSYLVYAVPPSIQNPALTAASLASVLGLDQTDILTKITATDKKYVVLKRALTDDEQNKIKQLALPGI